MRKKKTPIDARVIVPQYRRLAILPRGSSDEAYFTAAYYTIAFEWRVSTYLSG
jgi:hypothetical protein